jgi:hypothetical protein
LQPVERRFSEAWLIESRYCVLPGFEAGMFAKSTSSSCESVAPVPMLTPATLLTPLILPPLRLTVPPEIVKK